MFADLLASAAEAFHLALFSSRFFPARCHCCVLAYKKKDSEKSKQKVLIQYVQGIKRSVYISYFVIILIV